MQGIAVAIDMQTALAESVFGDLDSLGAIRDRAESRQKFGDTEEVAAADPARVEIDVLRCTALRLCVPCR